MAIVTLTADGLAVEVIAAASAKTIVQNNSSASCVIENAVDPVGGIVLQPKQIIELPATWIAAWNGKALNGVAVELRVAQDV